MIVVYKMKSIPKNMGPILLNDIYFNQNTVSLIDDRAAMIIKTIDKSELLSRYMISSRFDGTALNIDKLSTGCKTVLNVMYNPDKVFDIRECGDNALDVLYYLPEGNVCCDYPLISFDMEKAGAFTSKGVREFTSYEDLKEWWQNED